MAFDATLPANDSDIASSAGYIRTNFAALQDGSAITAASEPAYKVEGTLWYDSTNNLLKTYTGSAWQSVPNGTYDSGWFAVAVSTAYSKTHNLGTTKVLVSVYISEANDGSGKCAMSYPSYTDTANGFTMTSLSTTAIAFRSGTTYLGNFLDSAGSAWNPASGYCRIVMLALP
jgi:hypothetical protein